MSTMTPSASGQTSTKLRCACWLHQRTGQQRLAQLHFLVTCTSLLACVHAHSICRVHTGDPGPTQQCTHAICATRPPTHAGTHTGTGITDPQGGPAPTTTPTDTYAQSILRLARSLACNSASGSSYKQQSWHPPPPLHTRTHSRTHTHTHMHTHTPPSIWMHTHLQQGRADAAHAPR